MVRNITERFKKAFVAFDAEARLRLCESSGSEHSSSSAADSPTDLFDLVTSFVEAEGETRAEEGLEERAIVGSDGRNEVSEDDGRRGGGGFDYEDAREVMEEISEWNEDQRMILGHVKAACLSIGNEDSSSDFKRRLMGCLRKRGLDSGLCKSRWEKTGRYPAGDYQYVDVNMDGVRYIVEVSLAGQFDIARPIDQFASLLKLLPPIFVGTTDELKKVVRVLSSAVRQSLRSRGLDLPPWRKAGYTKAKWFSYYKRTTSSSSKQKCANMGGQMVGGFNAPFVVPPAGYCREVTATRTGHKTGLLTQVLAGPGNYASHNRV